MGGRELGALRSLEKPWAAERADPGRPKPFPDWGRWGREKMYSSSSSMRRWKSQSVIRIEYAGPIGKMARARSWRVRGCSDADGRRFTLYFVCPHATSTLGVLRLGSASHPQEQGGAGLGADIEWKEPRAQGAGGARILVLRTSYIALGAIHWESSLVHPHPACLEKQ